MLNLIDIIQDEKETASRMEKIRVVCIGDSITGWNNAGPQNLWPFPVYPTYLEQGLNEEVANFGIAGGTSDLAPELVKKAIGYLPNSQVYVLGFGTNDLGMNENPIRTTEEIEANLASAINYLKERHKFPVILSIPQAKLSDFPDFLRKVLTLKREYCNRELQTRCLKDNIPFIDIYKKMIESYLGDGLHPNEAGAEFIAKRILEGCKEIRG